MLCPDIFLGYCTMYMYFLLTVLICRKTFLLFLTYVSGRTVLYVYFMQYWKML